LEEPKKEDMSELDRPVTSFPALSLTPKIKVYPKIDRLDKSEPLEVDADPEQDDPAA
jgi:hypothetical protein